MASRKIEKETSCAEAGYTLMELLVVIAILGLLMVVVTPQVMKQFSKAKSDTAALQIETISSALEVYAIDLGDYPTSEEGLVALVTNGQGSERWNGPYVRKKKALVDPWGELFFYRRTGEAFEVYTLGADKVKGGLKADRDLSSADDIE